MSSVKKLAARFEARKSDLNQTPQRRDNTHQSRGTTPFALATDDASDNTTYITQDSSHNIYDKSSAMLDASPSGLVRQPRVLARTNLEMQPLAQSFTDSNLKLMPCSSPDSIPAGSEIRSPPPSQPARFLRNTKLDERSLSDSSTLTADRFSTESDHITLNSTLVSKSEVLPRSSSDGLPNVKPNTSSGSLADIPPHVSDHTPLPVTRLFARNAAPLYLPALDDVLGKLPRAKFTYPKPTKTGVLEPFPPLNLLRGRRLKDLVHNAQPLPVWRDWNSVGSTLVNWALSMMGSSAISTFYSLSGLYNAVQIFALILNTIAGHASGSWRQLILGTIPNVLALNIRGKLLESMAFLGGLVVVCGFLLFWFYRLTNQWMPNMAPEGLLRRSPSHGTHAVPLVSFILTILYLPLSTVSVHAITWSSDFWPVDNPYLNGLNHTNVVPLGPPSVFRDPLDFCWTTTMKKDEINYAPAVVIVGVLTLIFMTFWFPFRLAKTIGRSLPRVEPYDSLGQRRSEHELETEYQRLLERDKSPFSFLYNEYKRKWGAFKAFYLWVKLTSLLIVTLVSPDSCLALSLAKNRISRDSLAIARQAILLAAMIGFLFLQAVAAPFVDPVSNASEWTSRMNFVLTSLLGLLVALNVPGQAFWNGWGLYAVYIFTYGLTVYFTVVNWNWMHRVIKRLTRRVDFSIDIFSPRLDISPSSKHLVQRIWQESITTLLLAAPQCQMPASQKMMFVDGAEVTSEELAPPYLLDFAGSPAERHVENLKILREVGRKAYQRPLQMSQEDQQRTIELRHKILRHLIGPDAFWCPTGLADAQSRAISFFGNAWCIPFPLTVVIRYDHNGSLACIKDLRDLEHFVRQNEDWSIEQRREIRISIRCLDNTRVKWPYTHTDVVGNRFPWGGGRNYEAHRTRDYYEPILVIQKNGALDWDGFNLASGFGVTLRYSRTVVLDQSIIGLNNSLDLTPQLARFFLLNKRTLDTRIPEYLGCLRTYRDHAHREAISKTMTLSYGFLHSIYATPAGIESISQILAKHEQDVRVRGLVVNYGDAFETMDERMNHVGRDPIAVWWYIFWDDFWRRNRLAIAALNTHQPEFDPQYPTSVAYSPLPRAGLEAFLKQRGLWYPVTKWYGNWNWVDTGLINKIYFHLNWLAFTRSSKAIRIHLGSNSSPIDLLEIDKWKHSAAPRPTDGQENGDSISVTTSSGIRAGTSHSDSIMRTRRGYRWETMYQESGDDKSLFSKATYALHDHRWHFWHEEAEKRKEYWISWRGKLSQWFGLSPLGRLHWQINGLRADIVLEHSQEQIRYVRMSKYEN